MGSGKNKGGVRSGSGEVEKGVNGRVRGLFVRNNWLGLRMVFGVLGWGSCCDRCWRGVKGSNNIIRGKIKVGESG